MITKNQLDAIAASAQCTPETVVRYLARANQKPIVAKRIAKAIAELALASPVALWGDPVAPAAISGRGDLR